MKNFKTIVIGGIAGLLVFAAMSARTAQQQSFGVAQIMSDPAKFWNHNVPVNGIVGSVRQSQKTVNWESGEKVAYISFNLYEPGQGDRKTGSHYIYVNMPAAGFRYLPNDGDPISLTGPLTPPYSIGSIEQ